jgi:hypothetical protein
MTVPRVLYLTINADASAWWRVVRPVTRLAEAGYPCAWAELDDVDLATVGESYDAVVLTRFYWTDHEYGRRLVDDLHRQGLAVLYEIDDDWLSEGVSERLVAALRLDGTVAEQEQARADRIHAIGLVDGVLASSDPLAEVCRSHTRAPVLCVPNAIDAAWWADQLRDHERLVPGLTIGWLGGPRLDDDLAPVAVAWGRIAAAYPDVNFVVTGTQPGGVARYVPPERVWPIPWQTVDALPRAVANLDIACCAVAPHPWNLKKTPIKAWEATLSGAAVVATPMLYGAVVTGGQDGLLAETADEWEYALGLLIERPAYRHAFQARQRERVLREHSLETQAHRWSDAWAQLVGAARLVAA